MKLRALTIPFLLFASTAVVFAQKDRAPEDQPRPSQQKIAAAKNVQLTVCTAAGGVTVRGWDRNEVSVKSAEGATLELQRGDTGKPESQATKLQVLAIDPGDERRTKRGCQASTDIELNVPKGATVQVQTRDG